MNPLDKNTNSIIENNDSINLRKELEKYIIHWKWFLLATFLSGSLGFLYLRYTTPQYSASASIIIKDNQKSGISKELETFKDLGIIGGNSSNNPDNEIEILKSRKVIGAVIDSLQLNMSYFVQGRIKKSEIYKETPVYIQFEDQHLSRIKKDTSFLVAINNDTEFTLKNIHGKQISSHKFDEQINSKFGTFKVMKNTTLTRKPSYKEILVYARRRNSVIDSYKNRISIMPYNKKSSILILSLKDAVKEKAEDVLNELIKQYNLDAIIDKNEVSLKTKAFIKERLAKVWKALAIVQDDVKNYKLKNKISGLSKEAELILETFSRNQERIIDLESQILWAESLATKLQEETAKDDVLPTNLGFKDIGISNSILVFNELILRRNKLNVYAGGQNPQLIDLQSQINTIKENLKSSFSNLLNSLKLQLSQQNKEIKNISDRIAEIPYLERGMIDIVRQKEIYSGLYSYLLKKQEETSISLAVAVANAKIIDSAYSSGLPVSPNRKIIYLASIFLGLLVPFVILYLKYLLDTKVYSKSDIVAATSVPFIGSVPHSKAKEKIVIGKEASSRSNVAEAFRLIRTNLEFMLSKVDETKKGKTIFVTSTISGEGKSFISLNIASSLSLYDKKVLLLGMDLRVPKITEYLNVKKAKGLTNYISKNDVSIDDITFSIPNINLDIIVSGAIPPNPAELLLNKKVKTLFEELKQKYDYIIVDTAPVNLVTDTLLITKYADLFLYVVRANYLDKRLLDVLETLYTEKKLPNPAIILNDVSTKKSYGYDYGYGYGYGYTDEEELPWYKKIFN